MKTKQKLVILCYVFLIIIMPSCISAVHAPSSSTQKMSYEESINSIKEAIKDTTQNPWSAQSKPVSDVVVSKEGIKLIYVDNTSKYYTFNNMNDPEAKFAAGIPPLYFVDWGQPMGTRPVFNNSKPAERFAEALYSLKHMDIEAELKRYRERRQKDCQDAIRRTPIDLILAGTTADGLNLPCSGVPLAELESILNDNVVDWESKGLGERLQKSSPEQLRDLVVKLTKGIMKLDLKVKELKDAADEDARQVQVPGQAPPVKKATGALTLARPLEQRKTMLLVIQNKVRQVAALRSSEY